MNFKKYFLLYTIIPLLILSVASSYYRFMVTEEYVVEYEGDCNPEENSCFIGCEDDACTSEYYYSLITKSVPHLKEQCGSDISRCEAAQICLTEDGEDCSINYCDPELDVNNCKTIDANPTLNQVKFLDEAIIEADI